MGAPELLALSLGLSVVVAALGWGGGRLVERLSGDSELRDRVWAAALILPALPPLAIGLLLLTPAPVREIPPAPAGLPTALVTAPVEVAPIAAPAGLALDPSLAAWAVLSFAALLAVLRLAALALRARRLVRVIREAQAPDPAVTAMVETAARDLAIRPPCIGVSAATSEALLASLGRARLILPVGLGEAADAEAARAVIAHELAHLKRGDHRALWLEETLSALLAANPLMPVLRARRAAAREEACDALALSGASPEARRAYARSLIEALRDCAGPQASGGLPALTFTGTGRTTAMHRLRAVMNPAPAASRGLRLMALGLGGLIVALAGTGSLAVAGEREAVVRIQPTPATPPTTVDEQPRTVDLEVSRPGQGAAPRSTKEEDHLTSEQQARYRNPTAREYQALCASSDPGDGGFCAGVMFSQLGDGICPSPALDQGDETARRAALGSLVEHGKAEIARSTVRPGDTPASLARAALSRAYPCDAAASQATEPAAPGGVMARPLEHDDAAALGNAGGVAGESVLLTLDIDLARGVRTTPDGMLEVRIQPAGSRPRTRLQIPVGGGFDPIPMGSPSRAAPRRRRTM